MKRKKRDRNKVLKDWKAMRGKRKKDEQEGI